MKITKEVWECGVLTQVKEFKDIPHAVSDTEEDVREMLGRLCECLYDLRGRTGEESISYILGSGYEVSDD